MLQYCDNTKLIQRSNRMSATTQKPWIGIGMNGMIAHWYAKTRGNDLADFRREAAAAAAQLRSGATVLEVAPGPGFFAVELAKLGNFQISGLDASSTMVEIAARNAREAGVKIDFREGNASAMPYADRSFDFIYCSAAFKNFSEPVKALDEMHRVLRPGCAAVIVDLCKDTSDAEIDSFIKQSGRTRIDAWMTKWTFRHVLLKRAYTLNDFASMARQSRFGFCEPTQGAMGATIRFTKSEQSTLLAS
jgi:ubiquinone/menaquinone biosynthesis C-methylase UbiE